MTSELVTVGQAGRGRAGILAWPCLRQVHTAILQPCRVCPPLLLRILENQGEERLLHPGLRFGLRSLCVKSGFRRDVIQNSTRMSMA